MLLYEAWGARRQQGASTTTRSTVGTRAAGVPVVLTLLSLHSPAFSWFYDFGWFTGSALGGVIYYALGSLKGARATSLKPTV